MLQYFSVDSNGNANQITHNEKITNQQLNSILNSPLFSSNNFLNNEENNQDSSDSQNNIDFGHSILSSNSSVDDEFNFDRLGPFEKLCSLCDNPTPSNM